MSIESPFSLFKPPRSDIIAALSYAEFAMRNLQTLPKEIEMMTTSFWFTVVGTFDADKVPEGVKVTPEQEGQERVTAVLAQGEVHIPHQGGTVPEAGQAVYRYHMPENAPGMEDTQVYLRPFRG